MVVVPLGIDDEMQCHTRHFIGTATHLTVSVSVIWLRSETAHNLNFELL